MLAGVPGFEPGLSVLETDVLTVDTIPLCQPDAAKGRRGDSEKSIFAVSPHLSSVSLLRLFMISVLPSTATELAELKPIRSGFLILGRYVVAAFTCTTLKNNIIAWHFLNPDLCALYFVLCASYFGQTSKYKAPSTKF